jgi:hypothetical protein
MRIQWATICRYAEDTQAGLTVVGAGQTMVAAATLPADIRLYIAGTITDIGTVPATTTLRVAVVKDDDTAVASQAWKVDVDLADEIKHAPAIQPSIGFAVPLRFEPDEPGTYQVGIGLDGAVGGVLPLAIVLDRPMEDELQELL